MINVNVMFHRNGEATCDCCSCHAGRKNGGFWSVRFFNPRGKWYLPPGEAYCQLCYLSICVEGGLRKFGFPSPEREVRVCRAEDPCYLWYREALQKTGPFSVQVNLPARLQLAEGAERMGPVTMLRPASMPAKLLDRLTPRLRPFWPANDRELKRFRKFNLAIRG